MLASTEHETDLQSVSGGVATKPTVKPKRKVARLQTQTNLAKQGTCSSLKSSVVKSHAVKKMPQSRNSTNNISDDLLFDSQTDIQVVETRNTVFTDYMTKGK